MRLSPTARPRFLLAALAALAIGAVGAPAAVAAPSIETLEEAAKVNGKPISEIKRILADPTAKLDPRSRIYYVDPAPKDLPAPAFGVPDVPVEAAPYPYSQTFNLHSQPGSSRVIYLDFDGEMLSGKAWNQGVLGGPTGDFYAEPFSLDATPASFSSAEQDVIQSVWQRVAEDYAPFNVDVTTQDPGAAAITRTNLADTQFGTRALITDAPEIGSTCGCGGLAYLGVYDYTEPNHSYYQPALVFAENLASHDKYIAEATSHEVGHNLDLSHDGTASAGYYQGHGAWAPIMGVGYYAPITQWSKGEYLGANNLQDDLTTIVANGVPLLADDAPDLGSGTSDAGPASAGSVTGVVTTDADSDVFEIQAGAGSATFTVTTAPNSPNLDAGLTLMDSSFTTLATSDPPSAKSTDDVATGLGASITFVLPTSGTYYLAVDGRGALNPLSTGYSGYGSLGAYTLAGSYTPAPTDTEAPTVSSLSPNDAATGVDKSGNVVVTFSEAMNKSATESAFSLKTRGGQSVSGAFSWDEDSEVMTFNPASDLAGSTTYDAKVGTGAKDVAGNALAADKTWSFQTGDGTPPTIVSRSPTANATGVAVDTNIVLTFSESMNRSATVNAISIETSDNEPVVAAYSWNDDSTVLTYNPNDDLAEDTTYDVWIGTGARDAAGNSLAGSETWSFRTIDATPPTISSVSPADGATEVGRGNDVVVTFSEEMHQAASETAFSLEDGDGGSVSGTFSWNEDSTVMTFTPSSDLIERATYDAEVGTGATDASGNALAEEEIWSFEIEDVTAPTISSVSPADNAADVAVGSNVVVTFSEEMDESTTQSAFLLETVGGDPVSGAFSWNDDSTVMTFNPSSDLAEAVTYDAEVGTGATDASGNALATARSWSFETADITAPTLLQISPTNQMTGVARNTDVVVTFSEAMDRSATENAFSLDERGGDPVAGTFSWSQDSTVMTFDPSSDLAHSTVHDAKVGTGAEDAAGNAIATEQAWSFETVDLTAPTISSVVGDGAIGFAKDGDVIVTFSEAMTRATTQNAFSLQKRGGATVAGTFSWSEDSTVMTFNPTADLDDSATYDGRIGTGANDLAGNALAAERTWSFRTEDTTAPVVALISPLNQVTDVARDADVVVTFSEAMDQSATQDAFSLTGPGDQAVPGDFSWSQDSTVMTFDPTSSFEENTVYGAKVGTGAKDTSGNAMAAQDSWSFETAGDPPTISSVSPSNGSGEVARDADVVVTFSEAMDRSSAEAAFSLETRAGESVAGSFSWSDDSTVLTFDPASDLRTSTTYDVGVATSAEDARGNGLANAFASVFATEGPGVTLIDPAVGAVEVAVDHNVVVTFSDPMNRTATQGAFGLRRRGTTTKLSGAFTWNPAGTVMTFNPTSNLAGNTVYDVAVTTAARDLAGNPLGSAFGSDFRTDATGPGVTLIDPASGGSDVAVDKNVVVTFSEPMSRTATQSAFGLRRQGTTTKLGGAFTWNSAGTVMTFNPTSNLLANTVYEIAVTTAALDLAGNPLGSAFGSSFRTDATGPGVTLIDPAVGAVEVAVDRNVVVTFSESMTKTATQSAFGLRKQGTTTKLGGAFTWNSAGTVMTFNPTANLLANTVYEVAVTTAAKDVAGNALGSAFASSFRSDATGPSVTLIDPADGATAVAVNQNVVVTFSEPMTRTATQTAFGLRRQGTTAKLGGAFTWNAANTVMTFNPSANLLANTGYEISVTTAARDLAGNAPASHFGSSFTSQ